MPKISKTAKKVCYEKMQYRNRKFRKCPALTILEVVIALAIITIIFAAVLPQFRAIKNGWDSRREGAEVIQNGRVLIDHISRNLAKAVRINDVSEAAETDGFIEFQDNDGNNWRYDVNSTTSFVEFGLADGVLYDLAGPVNDLQFTCYDACDLDTPLDITTADINDVRYVEVQTTLINSLSADRNRIFAAAAYLRTNDEATSECDPNLVAWWKLDETSGLNAEDGSVNNNNGALTNMLGTEWTDGIIEGALDFDGINDYVDCGNDSIFDITGQITITCWVNTSDCGNSQHNPYVGKGDHTYAIKHRSDNNIEFFIYDGGWNSASYSVDSSFNGQWHHLAGTYDGSEVKLYVDGQLQDTTSHTGSIDTDTYDLNIARNSEETGRFYEGAIDDIRIYSRALDADEIAQLAETLEYQGFTEAKVGSDSDSITIPTQGSAETVNVLGSWETGTTHAAESGSNRLFVVIAHAEGDWWATPSLSDVTYGGQTMTKVADVVQTGGGGWPTPTPAYVGAFVLDEAGIAAATGDTITPTWDGWWPPTYTSFTSVFLSNVDQTSPVGDYDTSGVENAATITTSALSTNEGDMVVLGGTCTETGTYTVNNGFTQDIDLSEAGFDGTDGHKSATGAAETPSITHSTTTNRQALIGFVAQLDDQGGDGIEGDLLVAAVATDGDTASSLSPPAGQGWTEIDVAAYGGAVTLGAWYKIAEADEPASHEFTWSSLNQQQAYGWMMRFTGHDPDDPINDWAAYGQTSSTPTSPEVTTTVDNCIILRLGAFDNDDITEDDTGLTDHTTITMDASGSPSTITLFSDDFEGGNFNKWTDGGTTDWDLTTAQYVSAGHSAHAGRWDNDLISDDIDTSAYSEFTIEFQYMANGIDWNDDVQLELYNGSSYDYEARLDDNGWNQYSETIYNSGGDAQYFDTNFRIKFEATDIDNNEDLWIDDVLVTVPIEDTVSGGAGYIKQADAGDSGTENFALTSSNASQMLTIAIAPAGQSSGDCSSTIYP